MPSSTALSYLEPAFSPATTKLVFLETEDETLPPAARTASAASSRLRPGSVPVITTVTPASTRPAAADGSNPRLSGFTPAARPPPPPRPGRARGVGVPPPAHPPLGHDLGVPVDREPLHHRRRDRRADAVHDRQRLGRRGRDRVDRPERLRQRPGGGRPHVPDRQRAQDPPQRPGLRLLEVNQQRVRDELETAGLVHEERAAGQLLVGQVEQLSL